MMVQTEPSVIIPAPVNSPAVVAAVQLPTTSFPASIPVPALQPIAVPMQLVPVAPHHNHHAPRSQPAFDTEGSSLTSDSPMTMESSVHPYKSPMHAHEDMMLLQEDQGSTSSLSQRLMPLNVRAAPPVPVSFIQLDEGLGDSDEAVE